MEEVCSMQHKFNPVLVHTSHILVTVKTDQNPNKLSGHSSSQFGKIPRVFKCSLQLCSQLSRKTGSRSCQPGSFIWPPQPQRSKNYLLVFLSFPTQLFFFSSWKLIPRCCVLNGSMRSPHWTPRSSSLRTQRVLPFPELRYSDLE